MTHWRGQQQMRLPAASAHEAQLHALPAVHHGNTQGAPSPLTASSHHLPLRRRRCRCCCYLVLDTLPSSQQPQPQPQPPLYPGPRRVDLPRRRRLVLRSAAPRDASVATAGAASAEGLEGLDEIGAALREAARRRELLAAALAGGSRGDVLRLVIDCGFLHAVRSPAEFRSLAKQIQTSVGHNRRSEAPVCLQVTSWGGELAAYAEERMGAAAWPLIKHSQSSLELYDPENIVVLSPDAEEPLTALEERRVYVLGGIVDRSVIRGLTAHFAASHALEVRRLPTLEYSEQLGLGRGVSRRPVLNICDVVLALLSYRTNGGDWAGALDAAIPRRKRVTAAMAATAQQRSRPSRPSGHALEPLAAASTAATSAATLGDDAEGEGARS